MQDVQPNLSPEETFIRTFVLKDRRDRLLFELGKKRSRFLSRFSHDAAINLDPRYVTRVDSSDASPIFILKTLREKGATELCHAISCNAEIDGQTLPLHEAILKAFGYGLPSILCCPSGALVYLETEQENGPPDRFVLHRR